MTSTRGLIPPEALCMSGLKRPTFSAELWLCKQHDAHPLATTVIENGSPKLMTETDWAVAVAKLGPPESLKWQRLHYECKYYQNVPKLMFRIQNTEELHPHTLLEAEQELQKVKRAGNQFQMSLSQTSARSRAKPHQMRLAQPGPAVRGRPDAVAADESHEISEGVA